MYRLSKNFNIDEMRVSKSYPELASNICLSTENILSAQVLALTCLQPGRDKFGRFDIVSWVRNSELNKMVGGSEKSDHLIGCAADVVPYEYSFKDVFEWYVRESGINYRQIILYPERGFFHISCNNPSNDYKHEALIYRSPNEYEKFE